MPKPSEYNQDIAAELCQRLAVGESVNSICKDKKMPCRKTIYNWLFRYPEFVGMYDRAKLDSADALAEQIQEIADNPNGDVNRDRLRIDSRKWIAAKLKAKKYGDKVQNEVSGPDGEPISINVSFK